MNTVLQQFGTAAAEHSDLFGSLGINWTLLVLQVVAFLILLLILKKFVYPPLLSMLDKRDEAVRASADAAMEAEKNAAEAEARTAELIDEAKKEAIQIVATAKEEANDTADAINKKAEHRAEALVLAAKEEIAKEVDNAKQAIKSDTLDLVAMATSKVAEVKIDTTADKKLIEKALEGSE